MKAKIPHRRSGVHQLRRVCGIPANTHTGNRRKPDGEGLRPGYSAVDRWQRPSGGSVPVPAVRRRHHQRSRSGTGSMRWPTRPTANRAVTTAPFWRLRMKTGNSGKPTQIETLRINYGGDMDRDLPTSHYRYLVSEWLAYRQAETEGAANAVRRSSRTRAELDTPVRYTDWVLGGGRSYPEEFMQSTYRIVSSTPPARHALDVQRRNRYQRGHLESAPIRMGQMGRTPRSRNVAHRGADNAPVRPTLGNGPDHPRRPHRRERAFTTTGHGRTWKCS